ncbi:hypothetical protein V1289_002648 [Bradyrhizobium sp. AZCC 2289]
MRGIQYAAASRFNRCVSGILDHPHARVMTTEDVAHPYSSNKPPPSRGAFGRALQIVSPKEKRAQGMPGACCTRGLVRKMHKRKRTRAYRYSRSIPASPRNGFTAYAALFPATNSSCHRHRRIEGFANPVGRTKTSADLTPATGARTTRFCRTHQRRSSARRQSLTSRSPPCESKARRRCRVHRISSQRS